MTLARVLAVLLSATALLPAQRAWAQAAEAQPSVSLPQVVEHVDATYPPSRLAEGTEATTILFVTVEKDGTVSDVSVAESGGDDFDAAAIAAVKQWKFTSALQNGVPVRARIKVPFHFSPGAHTPPPPPPAQPPVKPPPEEPPHELPAGTGLPHAVAEEGKPIEIHVQGKPSAPPHATSDFRLEGEVLTVAPHATGADLLKSAPGFDVMHPEGDGAAQRVFLRGYDADHGQDIEFKMGGIPLNQASQLHGQGYADLNMIIPETVRSVRVVEGTYDPAQGDFAVAGSADFDLGVTERGIRVKASYGSFDTKRLLAMWAPRGEADETFAAGVFRQTDGYGPRDIRQSISGSIVGQYRASLPGDASLLLHLSSYAVRANSAGVLRRDDIDAGVVDFYDAYPDPTARAQSTSTSRTLMSVSIEKPFDDGSHAGAAIWAAVTNYQVRLNFTGYETPSPENPNLPGLGDLTEQHNQDTGFGGSAYYRTKRYQPCTCLGAQLTLGSDVRTHAIEQGQALIAPPENQVWLPSVDASVRVTEIGFYTDVSLTQSRYVRLHGGIRGNIAAFDIDDRQGSIIDAPGAPPRPGGYRRSAAGMIAVPRTALDVTPVPWLHLIASYGQGFRSPQARQLLEGDAPFTRVNTVELGARVNDDSRINATLALFQSHISSDLAFDAEEGRLESIGPTTRRGMVVSVNAQPITGFTSSMSATLVDAELDAVPPATERQVLPFIPPVVVRTDLGYHRTLFDLAGESVDGRIGAGATLLSPAPLPDGTNARGVFQLDASLGFRRSFAEVGVDVTNLLNQKQADTEYEFESNWHPRDAPRPGNAEHISAGPPLAVMGTVTLYL